MRFPLLAAALAVTLLAGVVSAADPQPAGRPNFLFIYTDDQRWDAMSVVQKEMAKKGRFPWLQTPNMDRLAREGVRFRNAFVVNSLCSPSRACFLTGRYSHLNGVVNNHTPFPSDSVTHASLLRKAGYRTGYVGKWHHGSQSGQRPGFDFSASYVGQSRYVDAPFEVNGKATPSTGWVDDVSTDYAIQFMTEAVRSPGTPFLLCLGYKSPHGPTTPPERLANQYERALARRAPNARSLPPYPRLRGAAPPAEAQPEEVPVNLNYFRVINAVDENVGRLLSTLDTLQLAQNTIVVYSSDNGYYLGEHGLGDKRTAYDESLRIPLLVRFPRGVKPNRRVDETALNIDLAPTFLDYAGVPIPGDMQGRSWRPLLEGRKTEWRKAFFYAYFYERGFAIPTTTAVRDERYKLVRYPGPGDWAELFDLKSDPYETRNLARLPEHRERLAAMQALYDREAAALRFQIPPFADPAPADLGAAPVPATPSPPAENRHVLIYDFSRDEGDRVEDTSGAGNHGQAHACPLTAGREGRRARRFSGAGRIEVPKSPSLRWQGAPLTVQITFNPEKPDGVLLARGGQSAGYGLHLEGGRLIASVRAGGSVHRLEGPACPPGAWTTVSLVIARPELRLFVNGRRAAGAALSALPTRDPTEGMQIGADEATKVAAYSTPAGFSGLVEQVRVYAGVE